ncbi:hypothetical protein WDW37_16825 [Bdellovibrionota bacterium FG-1]
MLPPSFFRHSSGSLTRQRWFQLVALSVSAGAILAGAILGVRELRFQAALSEARVSLERNLPFHAAEVIEPLRQSFALSPEGCRLALDAVAQVHHIDQLGWLIEGCEAAGFEGSELVIAKSVFYELRGSPDIALSVLKQAAEQKPGDPAPFIKMAQIYSSYGKNEIARGAWLAATAQTPRDVKLAYRALRFCYEHEYWTEAKRLATTIKPHLSEDDYETWALLASSFERGGDSGAAYEIKKKLLTQIGSNDKLKGELAKAYPEIFRR